MDNSEETITVQEAVTERFERIITAVDSLTNDIFPPPGVDFRIKRVIENLQLMNKMTSEMLQILVVAIIEDQEEDG